MREGTVRMQSNYNHADKGEMASYMERTTPQAPEDAVEINSCKILTFRGHCPTQFKAFIYSNWMNSLRFGNDYFKLTQSATFYDAYGKYITDIMHREDARVRVCVLSDDEDTALGFSVDEKDILHYVYVKKECRKMGIANFLVVRGFKTISHITHIGLSIWQEKYPTINLNPFL